MRTIILMSDTPITAIPAFTDNYLWLLESGDEAVVVDPGDAQPVLRAVSARKLQLSAILITHWHADHIGGLAELKARFDVPVHGPRAEAGKIPGLTHLLDDGDRVTVLGREFQVMRVPGHTLGHIAYYSGDVLFCGDTLFSAGCGRLFEGTPAQMHTSLARLAALPGETRMYCAHEYTVSNLAFARAVEPNNPDIELRLAEVHALRARGEPSLPSTIARERAFNPFLRSTEPSVMSAAQAQAGGKLNDAIEVFAALRRWKDHFRPPAPV